MQIWHNPLRVRIQDFANWQTDNQHYGVCDKSRSILGGTNQKGLRIQQAFGFRLNHENSKCCNGNNHEALCHQFQYRRLPITCCFKHQSETNPNNNIAKRPSRHSTQPADDKAIQDYAREAILAGRMIPGWKVVEGKKIRAFTDADAAMDKMREAGYEDAMLYDRKPKTLAQLEKLTGKKQFAELMGELITWPPGKPTLVTADDKRDAYTPVGPGEFAGVTDG